MIWVCYPSENWIYKICQSASGRYRSLKKLERDNSGECQRALAIEGEPITLIISHLYQLLIRVAGSSPARGANIYGACSDAGLFYFWRLLGVCLIFFKNDPLAVIIQPTIRQFFSGQVVKVDVALGGGFEQFNVQYLDAGKLVFGQVQSTRS
jgi:hypothetical protein